MIIIDRSKYEGLTWTQAVTTALGKGSNVTLKHFHRDTDTAHCKEIARQHKALVSLHLDHTVCCFEISKHVKHARLKKN
jgi:hypothetical protein